MLDKFECEKLAAKKLFSILQKDDSELLYRLWLEYEEQNTFEAKVVKALDKIECLLQVLEYRNGNLFKKHLDFSIDYGIKYANIDPAIKEYGDYISNILKEKFVEYKK